MRPSCIFVGVYGERVDERCLLPLLIVINMLDFLPLNSRLSIGVIEEELQRFSRAFGERDNSNSWQ